MMKYLNSIVDIEPEYKEITYSDMGKKVYEILKVLCEKNKKEFEYEHNDVDCILKVDPVFIIEVEELKKSTNFFVYIIPLICLIIGYFIGNYISKIANINHDLGPVISFVLFFVYVFFGVLKLKKNNKIIANIIAKNNL